MPELPEVELFSRYFAAHALDQRIERVRVLDERILGEVRKAAFVRALKGSAFARVRRHGKHLFAEAGRVWLHLHFGMTGDLAYYESSGVTGASPVIYGRQRTGEGACPPTRFARVVFDFDNGWHLAYEDMRLFGVVDLTPSPEAYIAAHELGPDPLELNLAGFRRIVAGRRGAVKSLLMSQDVIAGIGNLYADEILFQTSIHPRRAADRLSDAEVKAIFTTTRRILTSVIERKAAGKDYPARFLIPRREEGERCPLCGGTIRRSVVFGRTTYYCGKHQG